MLFFDKFLKSFTCLSVCLLCVAISPAHAVPLNGDFSAGLTNWTTIGDVSNSGDEALLGDGALGNGFSRLFQGVLLDPGAYTLSFDLFLGLSQAVPDFTAPDLALGTLYTTSDLGTFDIDTLSFDSAIALFDADFNGAFLYPDVFSSSSAKGAGWSSLMLAFVVASPTYYIPTFELFDLNGLSDSSIRVDNVFISSSEVPEPATILLLSGSALFGVFVRQKKHAGKNCN